MGGLNLEQDQNGTSSRISPKQLWTSLQTGGIPWSDISIDDKSIDDRSKADWVVKLLALAQNLWFSAQIIGRAVQGLSVTTLEMFTLGIVYCAFVTYLALWKKPFDIRVPITIRTSAANFARTANFERASYGEDDIVYTVGGAWFWAAIIFLAVSFDSIHVAAWSFYFPTPIERLLWRVSSVVSTAVPILSVFPVAAKNSDLDWIWALLSILYFLCRLYMFVEMFASLRTVPASVYQTPQWSQYFPSFG